MESQRRAPAAPRRATRPAPRQDPQRRAGRVTRGRPQGAGRGSCPAPMSRKRQGLPRRVLVGTGSIPYTSDMKIYTRTGDDGTTGLLGPGRVGKHEPRVEAYGAVDELNASLGAARALDGSHWLEAELAAIQSRLFNLGAELATVEPD